MKKHIALTALALILLAPGLAHAQSTSAVSRTTTVVERAALEQGFETPTPSANYVVPSLSTMAPEAPMSAAPVAPVTSSRPGAVPYGDSGSRPSMVTNGLPAGLVMNGPGTEEYKKKHRKKKKRAAAAVAPVEQAAPVESTFVAPEPTPEPAPAPSAPAFAPPEQAPVPVAPAPEALPPTDIPAVPQDADPAAPAGNGDLNPGDLGPGGIEPPAPLTP